MTWELPLAVTISKNNNHLALDNRDRWGALVPKGHPLTLIEKPSLTDALAYPLITSAQTSTEPSAWPV